MMNASNQIQSPTVSFVIPARNEVDYIDRCLDAIRNMKAPDMKVEIVVVDNGSTDNTVHIASAYGALVVTKDNGTIGSLRNFGAKLSSGDFIVFLDADCIVPEDWLTRALAFFAKDNKMIIGFRMIIPPDSNWVAQCWDALFSKRNVTSEVEWLPSGNMIMAREAFFSIEGFDEGLETNEDYDFCFRLRKRGYRIFSCAESAVVHLRPPQSLGQVFRKELWHGKEVFRVFIEDIFHGGDFNIFRKKNSKVILYAFVYLLFIIFLLLSLLLASGTKIFFLLFIALALPVIVSAILSMKYIQSLQDLYLMPGMTLLLMTYGFSRALSLLPFKSKRLKKG